MVKEKGTMPFCKGLKNS